jgi:lauroyl/myristoyl acyltransferase
MTLNALFSHQINTAQKVLRNGGIVNLHGDGFQGYSSGIKINFLGRMWAFRPSFAELAIATDARVVVVGTSMSNVPEENSKIQFHFMELDTGNKSMTHENRLTYLLNQYVDYLKTIWVETPWMIPVYLMKDFLNLPVADKKPDQ